MLVEGFELLVVCQFFASVLLAGELPCPLVDFVKANHYRLRQIHRGQTRIGRDRNKMLAQIKLSGEQAFILPTKNQSADAFRINIENQIGGLIRVQHPLTVATETAGCADTQGAISQGIRQRQIDRRLFEQVSGLDGHITGFAPKMIDLRVDQAQISGTIVEHGATDGANIAGPLRFYQNDCRTIFVFFLICRHHFFLVRRWLQKIPSVDRILVGDRAETVPAQLPPTAGRRYQ